MPYDQVGRRLRCLGYLVGFTACCLLEFQQWPSVLLRKARCGDVEALESLLQLDPLMAHEARIMRQVFELQRTKPERVKLLRAAMANGRTNKVSLADVKFALAGLLFKLSRELDRVLSGEIAFELLPRFTPHAKQASVRKWIKSQRERMKRKSRGCILTVSDIRKLFDAVAQETGKGWRDVDFIQDHEAFRKRVKRNASVWPDLRKWDKTASLIERQKELPNGDSLLHEEAKSQAADSAA